MVRAGWRSKSVNGIDRTETALPLLAAAVNVAPPLTNRP